MDKGQRLQHVKSFLRGSLWVLPTVSVVVALLAGLLLSRFEGDPDTWAFLVFDGGASAARSLLEAIAGSLITVTSLTFSLMVVVLQTSASQYSPRLLRKFLRDLKNQTVLSVFLSTFAFAVVVLPSIQDSGDNGEEFVPRLAVTLALVLAIASIAALVLLIYNITQSIRVDAIMSGVSNDTTGAIERNGEHLDDTAGPDAQAPPPPPSAAVVRARESGYVQSIVDAPLVEAVRAGGAMVLFRRSVGEQVVEGAPIALAWRPGTEEPVEDVTALEEAIGSHVQIGYERTLQEDIAFGLRQLTDIAVKSLSPGINDPSTAVDALGRLASILRELARHQLGAEALRDEDSVLRELARHQLGAEALRDADAVLRVALPRPRFGDYLGLVVEPVSRYGAQDLGVLTQLLRMLEDLGTIVDTDERRAAVRRSIDLVVLRAHDELTLQRSLERVEQGARHARAAVQGDVEVDDVFVL